MLANGSYSVLFRTKQGEGTGIVTLSDGRITGRDDKANYSGSYSQLGDCFTALIRTQRHRRRSSLLLSIEEFEIILKDRSQSRIASASGTMMRASISSIHVTLIPINGDASIIRIGRR